MKVKLATHSERVVWEMVESGDFESPEEVVWLAIQQFKEVREDPKAGIGLLRRKIDLAHNKFAEGRDFPLGDNKEFKRKLLRRVRAKLARHKKRNDASRKRYLKRTKPPKAKAAAKARPYAKH